MKSDGLSVERKLKLLTANADHYFWHAGLEVEKRSKEARLKLRKSVLQGLTKELEKFERVTDETNRELRAAQVAAVGRKASGRTPPGSRTRFNGEFQGNCPGIDAANG